MNKRVDKAVMNNRVLAREICLKLRQQVTVSEQLNGQANERLNKQVDKKASGQVSGLIPIKALSDSTGPFGMTSTNACFVIDLKFEI